MRAQATDYHHIVQWSVACVQAMVLHLISGSAGWETIRRRKKEKKTLRKIKARVKPRVHNSDSS